MTEMTKLTYFFSESTKGEKQLMIFLKKFLKKVVFSIIYFITFFCSSAGMMNEFKSINLLQKMRILAERISCHIYSCNSSPQGIPEAKNLKFSLQKQDKQHFHTKVKTIVLLLATNSVMTVHLRGKPGIRCLVLTSKAQMTTQDPMPATASHNLCSKNIRQL